MSEHDIVSQWMQIAYEDYDSALYLFEHKHPKPLEIICYHCQQSAEKALKAYLCSRGADVPKVHEVGLLCRRCKELDEEFSAFLTHCEELEIFATQTRYPNRMEIEEHNANRALKQALALYNFVLEKLSV
jgi:HEPN domain-containing protein